MHGKPSAFRPFSWLLPCGERRRCPAPLRAALATGLMVLALYHATAIAQTYTEDAKLVASDAAADDFFGYLVSVSGDTMVVGAYGDDCIAGANCGSAYVFKFDGAAWIQRAKLTASDAVAGDVFGPSVSINGGTIVVGAPADDCVAGSSCGSAYVFVMPGGGWSDMTQTAKLTASDAAAGDLFGQSVSISGDTIIVGAYLDDCVAGSDCGSAYVFVKPGGEWVNMTQTAKLTASDAAADDWFGYPKSLSISGDTVVVGAQQDDCGAGIDCGSAYVFVKPGGGWSDMTQTAKLTASDAALGDEFGISASIAGDTIVVGADADDCGAGGNCGSAYVFVKPGGSWSNMNQTAKLTASDAAVNDAFGFSVSISGNTVIVGAGNDDCGAGADCGSAYVFVKPGGGWSDMTPTAKLTALDAADSDFFGNSVAVDGATIVVGSFRDDCGAGADCGSAYVFNPFKVYVDLTATALNDGTSWVNAYSRLQDALSFAAANPHITEIWVADGTYKPTDKSCTTAADCGGGAPNTCPAGACVWDQPRQQSLQLVNGVALYGGFAGGETSLNQRSPTVNETILSGDIVGDDAPVPCAQNSPDCLSFGRLCDNGFCIIADNNDENSYHVVTGSGTDATAILDGFTMTAGNADAIFPENIGGGMYNNSGSPSVINCTFRANSTINGGAGIYNAGSTATVTNCTFSGNSGGGMLNTTNSSPTITNCIFSGNSGNDSGGMLNANSAPMVTNCTFNGNSAFYGGGMYNLNTSNPVLVNCTFSGNTAGFHGGGMYNANTGGNPVLVNCTFSGNSAFDKGGGIYNSNSSSPALVNCLLWGNSDSGGMDESAQFHTSSGTPVVNYSIVQGGWSGAGSNNLNANPLFIDADGADNIVGTEDDDVRLMPGSPAIDAANTPALPLDTDDADEDGNTTERYPFDLAGKPRILDDPGTVDTGVPGSPVVDMGAYEYFGDCNGNGIPDQCDVSCGVAMGPCDLPGCGGSGDCGWAEGFPNGIPDECDLAGCGIPDCDDCNLNGVPDACDIASATSLDTTPMDGIPDECVTAIADDGCIPPSNDWTCGGNWPLGGTNYPDNQGDPNTVPNLAVTLDNVALFLNETVELNGLRLINDAILNVTQSGAEGDLIIAAPGGLLLEGKLYAGPGRVISIPGGLMRVQGRGFYGAPPALLRGDETHQKGSHEATKPRSHEGTDGITNYEVGNSLLIDNRKSAIANPPQALGGPVCGNGICEEGETSCNCPTESTCGACLAPPNLTFSNCDPCSPGMCDTDDSCDIILTGTMALNASGSIMMDGLSSATGEPVCPCCPCTIENTMACGGSFLRGAILPPPKFRASMGTHSYVDGDLGLIGTVDLHYYSNNNLNLAGNFDNQLTTPACFDWSTSGITMVGLAPREIEAAGRDLGNSLSGFYYGPDTNFSLGELEIAANRSVTLVNRRNNLVGTGACQEALYVHHLILPANATLTLSNTRIYYEMRSPESGGTILTQGCGQAVEVAPCPDAEACGDGNACTVDACNEGMCANVPIASLTYGDTAYTGEGSVVDVDDILCVLDAFAGIFNNCPVERADLTPCNIAACTTDDDCAALGAPCVQGRCHLLDVDDILAVLDAFVGLPGCPDPCP